MEAIELNNITVNYGKNIALNKITASVPRGRVTAIIGPNGSGKSTLLKAVVGLVPLRQGSIKIFGLHVNRARKKLAYVPQQDQVDWHYPLLAWEVVALGCFRPEAIWRRPSYRDRFIIHESMEKMGIADLMMRPIAHLSGGQRQRIFLARALVQQPELYLLDEPFIGVDAATETAIMEHIRQLKQEGKTVVLVHHKLNEVADSFDRVILLNKKLISAGPTEQAFTEETVRITYGGFYPTLNGGSREVKTCLSG